MKVIDLQKSDDAYAAFVDIPVGELFTCCNCVYVGDYLMLNSSGHVIDLRDGLIAGDRESFYFNILKLLLSSSTITFDPTLLENVYGNVTSEPLKSIRRMSVKEFLIDIITTDIEIGCTIENTYYDHFVTIRGTRSKMSIKLNRQHYAELLFNAARVVRKHVNFIPVYV